MIGTALRRTGAGLTSPPAFTNTVAAFWAGDPAWSNPGNGNAVSSWRDYSGQNRTALQGVGSQQPIFRAQVAALNNQPAIEFDATNDVMNTAAFTATGTTSHTWLIVALTGASFTGYTRVFGAATGNASIYQDPFNGNKLALYTTGAAPAIPNGSSALASSTAYAFRWTMGTGAQASINGTTYSPTGTAAANALTTIQLGGDTSFPTKGHIAYAALIDANATADPNWSTFVSWVASTYGLTIA